MLIPFKEIVRKYGKPKGILHVGANVGEEAKDYSDANISKVLWIEANTELYSTLLENIAPYHGHFAMNLAIGNENKKVILHVSNNAGQSSSILELGTHKQAHPEVIFTHDINVEMSTIEKIFDSIAETQSNLSWISDIDFLNFDIQGMELEALKGMGSYLHDFKYAYLEINKKELYKGCALWPEVEKYMNGFGFKTKEIRMAGNTGWGDCLMIKR